MGRGESSCLLGTEVSTSYRADYDRDRRKAHIKKVSHRKKCHRVTREAKEYVLGYTQQILCMDLEIASWGLAGWSRGSKCLPCNSHDLSSIPRALWGRSTPEIVLGCSYVCCGACMPVHTQTYFM